MILIRILFQFSLLAQTLKLLYVLDHALVNLEILLKDSQLMVLCKMESKDALQFSTPWRGLEKVFQLSYPLNVMARIDFQG